MSASQSIANLIFEVLEAEGLNGLSQEEIQHRLEAPKDSSMGDVAFPCFTLSKQMKRAPQQIAAHLSEKLGEKVGGVAEIESQEPVGPYINFFLSSESLAQVVPAILEEGALEPWKANGERVMIEYSQPNTHKAFHVGHMRNVALGDALVRLYEYGGYDVTAANYIGDEGTHIAKCLWAYEKSQPLEVTETHRGEFLGGLYRKADEWLDFKRLTSFHYPGVIDAQVK